MAADLSQPILLTPDHFIALGCDGYRSEEANNVQQFKIWHYMLPEPFEKCISLLNEVADIQGCHLTTYQQC